MDDPDDGTGAAAFRNATGSSYMFHTDYPWIILGFTSAFIRVISLLFPCYLRVISVYYTALNRTPLKKDSAAAVPQEASVQPAKAMRQTTRRTPVSSDS